MLIGRADYPNALQMGTAKSGNITEKTYEREIQGRISPQIVCLSVPLTVYLLHFLTELLELSLTLSSSEAFIALPHFSDFILGQIRTNSSAF